jgi:hypothetical protein
MIDLNDIVAKRFGKLVVLKYDHYKYYKQNKQHFYLCKCDCGNETLALRNLLLNGHKTSCGCASHIQDLNDIVGQKFGMLTVEKYLYSKYLNDKYLNHFYLCKCDCGNEITTTRYRLTNKKDPKTSCGCVNNYKKYTTEEINNIIGKRFGKLVVLKYDHYEYNRRNRRHMYLCKCDCGNEAVIERYQLTSGKRVSCGCARVLQDYNDIVGKKYGMLTVLKYDHSERDKDNHLRHIYLCKCDCGNKVLVSRYELNNKKNGRTSCGCAGKIADLNDIIGQKYGMLTVIEYDYYNPKQFKHYYKCKCDCGNITSTDRNSLKNGHSKSCGCNKGDLFIEKHGMSKTRFYNIWYHIKDRCYNPKCMSYPDYGGRGIKVCDRWLESFENFRDDMYESYLEHAALYGENDTSIDRIDVNGNYCPENCRWATDKVQANNKRTTHYVNYNGESLSVQQFAEKYSSPEVTPTMICSRIVNGWDLDTAICEVTGKYNGKPVICPIRFKE